MTRRQRYGCVNEHNGWVPRDFWSELWEKQAIIDFHLKNPLEGYRRLTFMMLDAYVPQRPHPLLCVGRTRDN
jgi:putative transposase